MNAVIASNLLLQLVCAIPLASAKSEIVRVPSSNETERVHHV